MNAENASRRSRKTLGWRRRDSSHHAGSFAEIVKRLELREKLIAIIDELDHLDADVDVPRTIAEGLLEDVDREMAP